MKKINCILFSTLFSVLNLLSQASFSGTYIGQVNGDLVKLKLQAVDKDQYQGTLEDSQQKFNVTAAYKEGQLSGYATEASMGVRFQFNTSMEQQQLKVSLFSAEIGMTEALVIWLQREPLQTEPTASTQAPSETTALLVNFQFPKEAQHHKELTGIWRKEELYNSGIGSDYMGTSTQQKMILFENGQVADGGSQTTISGSNYFGQSSSGFNTLENVYWYNVSNQLYLVSIEEGKTNTIHLGKYYIENGAMLVTSSNGSKSLFYKE